MGARGDFRHDAAKGRVQVGLVGDDGRQDLGRGAGRMAHDGGCGVVAAAFETEDGQRGHGRAGCKGVAGGVPPKADPGNPDRPNPVPDQTPALLLTRPREQSEQFATDCRKVLGRDANVMITPVLDIRYRDVAVETNGMAGIVFTSENGVRALAARTEVAGRFAYCVGDRTAEAAESLGMSAISAGGAVEDLVALIRRAHPEGPLLYVHGADVSGNLAEALKADGIVLQSLVLYDQVPVGLTDDALNALRGDRHVLLPLFSPRSAELVGQAAAGATAPLAIVALSPAVAEAWSGPLPMETVVAPRPDAPAMLDAIATIYARLLA